MSSLQQPSSQSSPFYFFQVYWFIMVLDNGDEGSCFGNSAFLWLQYAKRWGSDCSLTRQNSILEGWIYNQSFYKFVAW